MVGKISEMVEITTPATGDFVEVLDVSDTSGGASGTNKKITQNNLLSTAVLLTGNQSVTGTKTFDLIGITSGITSANGINFGADVNLYRVGVNNLITDDNFTAVSLTTTTAGDALSIASTGKIVFSSDTNLYRLSSNSLKTDDALSVAGGLFVENTANLSTAGINGSINLSGTSFGSYDVNLYASATNTLKTDDNLIIGGTVASGAGNAVTVDGTQTLTNKTLTAPAIQGNVDGWTLSTDTWVYGSATTFTISGVDRTAMFSKGTRLKLTQTTAKYFYVINSSFSTNTTVTVTGGSDYTLANAAITLPYYSYQQNPQLFPSFFNYSPTYTGFSADPTNVRSAFRLDGTMCTVFISQGTNGTSNATGFSATLPVTASNIANGDWREAVGSLVDNSAVSTTTQDLGVINNAATVVLFLKNGSTTGFTASGGKRVRWRGTYEI